MATIKMATKEQEWKALAQIKEIVEGLGATSYIGMAIDGMLEDAEENIKNDFALSMKDRYETEKKRTELLNDDVNQLTEENQKLREEIEMLDRQKNQERDRYNDLLNRLHETEKTALENLNELGEARAEVKWQADEILHLKAKLYDFMVKEA